MKLILHSLRTKLPVLLVLAVFCIASIDMPSAYAAPEVNCYKDAYSNKDACRDYILTYPYFSDELTACVPTGGTNSGVTGSSLSANIPEPYRTAFTKAATTFSVNPNYIATLYMTENGNQWYPDPYTKKWPVSPPPSNAAGPMQFIPDSWTAYQEDGNGDGKKDVNNLDDAAHAAAKLIGVGFKTNASTPLGTIERPYAKDTFLRAATNYNWGEGNVRKAGINENSDLSPYRKQTSDYIKNIVSLMESGFTKSGIPQYKDPNQLSGTPAAPATSQPLAPTTQPASADKTVIAIDPGHGGAVAEYIDPVTGLADRETTNSPEREDAQEIANQVKAGLETAGYSVVLLKDTADQVISKRARIDKAKAAQADMGISIHTDSSAGSFDGPNAWAEVWPQFVGGYRQLRNDPKVKITFDNKEVADKSNKYADAFVSERDKAERASNGKTKKVVGQPGSFGANRPGELPSIGDISLMQLWADNIPWVYHESGAPAGGLTPEQKQKYAQGLINGVKLSLPTTAPAGAVAGGCNVSGVAADNGNAVATAISFAWPFYKKPYTEKKPEYEVAVQDGRSKGMYLGGCNGVDCGAFVTRVMVYSGYEPRYNFDGKGGPTETQRDWLEANWQKIGAVTSTDQLQPGDAAWEPGHTFMYVGEQPGFPSIIASASLCSRAPMAGKESISGGGKIWYRKKV